MAVDVALVLEWESVDELYLVKLPLSTDSGGNLRHVLCIQVLASTGTGLTPPDILTSPVGCESLRASAPEANLD